MNSEGKRPVGRCYPQYKNARIIDWRSPGQKPKFCFQEPIQPLHIEGKANTNIIVNLLKYKLLKISRYKNNKPKILFSLNKYNSEGWEIAFHLTYNPILIDAVLIIIINSQDMYLTN